MTLTAEQHRARDGKVTASFAPALMAGDESRIMEEWRRLIGDPEHVEPDFSDNWPVQFGSFIETFALDWWQRKSGQPLTRRGEVVVHPARPYVSCTLDAWREADNTVIDCKAPGMWRKLDDVCAHYLPQLVVQRACVGAARAGLLIVHGGSEPAEYPLEWDTDYEAAVWDRVGWFWSCVTDLTPPVAIAPVAAPAPAIKTYDMAESNAWAEQAAAWLAHRIAAKAFDAATKEIKALVPADAKLAHGHGLSVSRNKAGGLSIKETAP